MLFFCWIALAGSASAQPPVVPDRISTLQKQVERLRDEHQQAIAQRDQLASRVERVASEIRRRKAKEPGAKLLPDLTLEELLQRSQELSRRLGEQNRQVDSLARAQADQLGQLNLLYGQWIDQLGEQIKQSREPRSQELLDLLARARLGREQIRKQIEQPSPSAPPLPTESMARSEDPEELREQADAVRDEQDKLRRRLRKIESQIAEVEAEKRLERNLRDFVQEQSLFGEDMRTLRFRRSTSDGTSSDAAAPTSGNQMSATPPADMNAAESLPAGSQPGDTSSMGSGTGTGGAGGTGAPSAPEPSTTPEISDADRTPSVFPVTPEGRFLTGREGPSDRFGQQPLPRNIGRLQRERQRVVEELKKMQILYDRLQEKVESLPR